jgi:hypothetical protein
MPVSLRIENARLPPAAKVVELRIIADLQQQIDDLRRYGNFFSPTIFLAGAVIGALLVANVASYFFQNPAPAGSLPKDEMNENCSKALINCQSELVTSKDLLEECKGILPTLKSQRDEAVADWKTCLGKLATLINCQSELVTSKDLLEKCKRQIPTLKSQKDTLRSQRDETMADWKTCLENLEAYQNCTNANLANHTDLLSRIEACTNSIGNKTIN